MLFTLDKERVLTFSEKVAGFCRHEKIILEQSKVFVGFSGGCDSLFLLLILQALKCFPKAVHFNHNLRGEEADHDEQFCRELCREQGIEFQVVSLNVLKQRRKGESIEEAARRMRLEYWAKTLPKGSVLALGHHADDVLEDLFLRLNRGSNSSGLTGLRPVREVAGVSIVRPLMCFHSDEIHAALQEIGVTQWCHDSSNDDNTFRRNFIRNRVLPLLREEWGNTKGISCSFTALRDDADFLETQAQKAVAYMRSPEDWRGLHPALLPRVLRLYVREIIGYDFIPKLNFIERLKDEIGNEINGAIRIPFSSDLEFVLDKNGLRPVSIENNLCALDWNWKDNPELQTPYGILRIASEKESGERFDADSLCDRLTVRTRRPGDRMIPFRRKTPKKLKDLMIDAGVPLESRGRIPLVCSGETIVWVPGVRRASFGAVGAETKKTIRMTFSPNRTPFKAE